MTAAPAAAVVQGPGRLALGLGHAGLLPFIAGGLGVWLAPPAGRAAVLLALSVYAAVIVSFLGGIHWGLAMRQPAPAAAALVWGVVPSLVAGLALWLQPPAGLGVLALMLLACFAVDRPLYRARGVQAWLPLRLRLTAVAAASCLAGAAGA